MILNMLPFMPLVIVNAPELHIHAAHILIEYNITTQLHPAKMP